MVSYFELKQWKIGTPRGDIQQILDGHNRTDVGIGYSRYCYELNLVITLHSF